MGAPFLAEFARSGDFEQNAAELFAESFADFPGKFLSRRRSRYEAGERHMTRQSGFTLLELMIVIALIVIIAAITIPSVTEAKIHATEASALASIRAISVAEVAYQSTYGGYPPSLQNLGGAEPCTRSAETACLIDQSLAEGAKSGYRFTAIGGNPSGGLNTSYAVGAAPEAFGRTGRRLFCTTDKNVIRADLNSSGSTVAPDASQCATFSPLR
jgi:prepilin-type N-terminal cleavage/methylation domain-containing protein